VRPADVLVEASIRGGPASSPALVIFGWPWV
jgi:hypothetical protein